MRNKKEIPLRVLRHSNGTPCDAEQELFDFVEAWQAKHNPKMYDREDTVLAQMLILRAETMLDAITN